MRDIIQKCLTISVLCLLFWTFPTVHCFSQEQPPSSVPPSIQSVQDPLQQGQQLLIQGDLDGAARAFEKVLKKTPMNPDANYYMGVVHLQKNEPEPAIRRFQNVLATNPNHLLSHYYIGLSRKMLDQLDEAIASFKKAIEIEPRYYPAYLELGNIYEFRDRVEEAVLYLRAVVDLARQIPEAQELGRQTEARLVQLGGDPGVARQIQELYKKAQAAMKEGRLEGAAQALNEILDRYVPQHVIARFLMAQIHLRQGQVLEASKRLEEAAKIDSQAWRVFLLLAQVYAAQGFFDDAISAYTTTAAILGRGPTFEDIRREVLTLREVKEERERLEQLRERLPLREARSLFNKGIALLKEGKADEAIVQIEQAIEKDPKNPYYFFNLGIAYFNQNNFILATGALQKAINLNEKFGPAHFFLGLVYNASADAGRYQGNLVGATEEYYKSAAELKMAVELGMEEWAIDEARTRLSRMEKAVADFQESLGHTILATALLDRKEYEKAIQEYRIAAERVPEDPVSRISIGQVYETLGRDEEAIAAYQEAIKASPRSPDPHVSLGTYFEKKKELEKAREAYQTAQKLDPRLPEPLIRLGVLHFDQNQYKEAQEFFEKALKLDPRQVEPHFYMAQVLEKQGNDEMAIIEYEQVAKVLPEGSESRTFALQRAQALRRFSGNWSHTFFSYDDNANYSNNNPIESISSAFNLQLSYRILRLPQFHRRLPIPLTMPLNFQSSTQSFLYSETIVNSESLTLGLQSNFLENYALSSRYQITYNYNDITGPLNITHYVSLLGSRTAKIPSQLSLVLDFRSVDSLIRPQDDRVSYSYATILTQSQSLGKYGNASLSYTFSNRDYLNIDNMDRVQSLELGYTKLPLGTVTFEYSNIISEDASLLAQSGKDHRFSAGYSNTLFGKLGLTTGLDYTLSRFDVPRIIVVSGGVGVISTFETANTFTFRLGTSYGLANGLNFSLNYSLFINQSNLNIDRANLTAEEQAIAQQLTQPTRSFGDYRKHLISLAVSKSF